MKGSPDRNKAGLAQFKPNSKLKSSRDSFFWVVFWRKKDLCPNHLHGDWPQASLAKIYNATIGLNEQIINARLNLYPVWTTKPISTNPIRLYKPSDLLVFYTIQWLDNLCLFGTFFIQNICISTEIDQTILTVSDGIKPFSNLSVWHAANVYGEPCSNKTY